MILHDLLRILHQCNGVKNHTTRRSQINAPEGEFNEGFGDVGFSPSWVGDRCSPEDLCSCSPVAVLRAVLALSSGCPPCRARVRGWPVKRCSLEYNADCRVSMESSGDMSPQCVCCGGLSSPAVTSLRCARPARDEDVQVILVGFQGDGNERSGHASQYVYVTKFVGRKEADRVGS